MDSRTETMRFLGIGFVALAMVLCYSALPFIGGMILIVFDYAAFGFRWFGIRDPAEAWIPLGAIGGALVGLSMVLRRVGKLGSSYKVAIWGASGFAALYVLSFLYSQTMKPVKTLPAAAQAPAAATGTPAPPSASTSPAASSATTTATRTGSDQDTSDQ